VAIDNKVNQNKNANKMKTDSKNMKFLIEKMALDILEILHLLTENVFSYNWVDVAYLTSTFTFNSSFIKKDNDRVK
jgi:hypothetical protein